MKSKQGKLVMKWVIIAAIIIIPVLYSFFYLKAFWDPYGNLQDLKVAVVNRDTGEDRSKSRKRIDRLIN